MRLLGLGKEILERRALDVFHLARAAIAGIEIILEKGAKIDFFEGIFLLFGGRGSFFGGRTVAVFLAAADIVE